METYFALYQFLNGVRVSDTNENDPVERDICWEQFNQVALLELPLNQMTQLGECAESLISSEMAKLQ